MYPVFRSPIDVWPTADSPEVRANAFNHLSIECDGVVERDPGLYFTCGLTMYHEGPCRMRVVR